ncbi:MAG: type II toxin-antitoxin system VapC family toxin [Acidimicrobiales bacterium]
MTIACFDSSAFVKLLVDEPGSDLAEQLWNEADSVAASRLALPEVSAALSAARRAARLDVAGERTARRTWSTFWPAVDVVDLTSSVAADAADLAARLLLGGADAVHLASARALGAGDPVLVSWDRRLSAAALETGLSIAPSGF